MVEKLLLIRPHLLKLEEALSRMVDETEEGKYLLSLRGLNPDFCAWARKLRERPVHANPLNGKEVVGAALNRLLRLAFTLVKKQTFYQIPQPELAKLSV